MNNLEELEKKYEELGKEIERLKNEKKNVRWRAETQEHYYYINSVVTTDDDIEDDYDADIDRYNTGNYFKTREQAEKQLKKLKIYMQLKDLALRLNNGEKIDWDNGEQNKYKIYYNCGYDKLSYDAWSTIQELGAIYCLDINFYKEALEEIGEENLKLLFGVENEL